MTLQNLRAPKERTAPFSMLNRMKYSVAAVLVLFVALVCSPLAQAQSGGGGITGTVVDSTGAVIPNATVTALNVATGVTTVRTSSSSGVYTLNPLLPGTYTITVASNGFSTFKQENVVVDALENVGLNVTLKNGIQSETITVSAAPPELDTTSATLGGTIENSTYSALPLLFAGSQGRDITQFSNLLPGAQVNPGGRSSIIAGTGQRVGELYVDGLPLTTASQQGDNRPVFNVIPFEAIDQIKVVTSGYNAQYQGAGLENYNLKAGTNKFHGSVFTYLRNTIFDAWSFSTKPGAPGNTVPILVNGVITRVPGPKQPEHQIEYGYAVGGPISIPHIINGHDKLFFFTTLDRFRSRIGVNPGTSTIPTLKMRTGDFSELLAANGGPGYILYDPTTQALCTANNNTPCRYPYGQAPSGPVDNTKATNIIPASQISPITQYMAKFLPTPTSTALTNNYISGVPSGFDNQLYSARIDYTISPRQTLSGAYSNGRRHAIPYTGTASPGVAIVPYITTTTSTITGQIADIQHTYQITPNLTNQARYGFIYFGGPPVGNITGTTNPALYGLAASGITGLPAGQASNNAANLSFAGTNAETGWVGNTPTTTNRSLTYEFTDNLALLKGKHSMNFGGQIQWLENNADAADGPSTPTSLGWSTNETANLTAANSYVANTGFAYASFLLGAVSASSTTLQPFSIVGGRFRPAALYFQDDFKLTSKITINAGLRWDYIPPYLEALDRWSFLNPNLTNSLTGNLGMLQFAGNRGAGLSCQCRTPVNTYWKNFEPRVGFAYAVDSKTVFRGGYSLAFSHGGATGGAAGAGTGTGQTGFSTPISFADSTAGPAFYLNTNPAFSNQNSKWGGANYTLATTSPISPASQTLGTGFYVNAAGGSGGTGSGINYADPYIGSRAPEFSFFNFGMQREITKNMTISLDYAGSQSHFISGAGGIRGLYAGQLDPKYLVLGANLTKPATTANIAAAQTATGLTLPVPYPGYTAVAALSPTSTATIAHMLTWKPQYSGTSDFWGNYVANGNYNSFQVALAQRATSGLSFNVNYTYSQNVDDAGTQRSGYDIPASVIADGVFHPKNRIDRSISINDQPQNLSVYGVYNSQYGKGSLGGEHVFLRQLLSGWQTSLIFQLSSGLPLPIVGTCNAAQNVGQGTCMSDMNPNFHGNVRINGKWGQGVTAATLGTNKYLQGYISSTTSGGGTDNNNGAANAGTAPPPCSTSVGPFCNSGNYMIGDAPRFPYNLRGPDNYRLNMGLRRTFPIHDSLNFVFGVDGANLTNHTTFGNNVGNNQIQVNVNNAAFGTLNFASGDPRSFQFSGRINF